MFANTKFLPYNSKSVLVLEMNIIFFKLSVIHHQFSTLLSVPYIFYAGNDCLSNRHCKSKAYVVISAPTGSIGFIDLIKPRSGMHNLQSLVWRLSLFYSII